MFTLEMLVAQSAEVSLHLLVLPLQNLGFGLGLVQKLAHRAWRVISWKLIL